MLCRCLEYMDHLITLLEEHPEVELHDKLKDDEENFSVSHCQNVHVFNPRRMREGYSSRSVCK